MSVHPLIGQAYDVQADTLPPGLDDATETLVPVGYDDIGNLLVDHYVDDEGRTQVWSEDAFATLVDDGAVVEEYDE